MDANPKFKANPNLIRKGDTIKMPGKVKDRKSVYQGMTKKEMAKMHIPKKKKLKQSTAGGDVAFSRGGKIKGYKSGGSIRPRGVGAALRGWGKALG